MKKLRIYLILLLFSLVGSLSAQGQRITLTGIVNDSITQEPIEFITIQEKGTTNGTITDLDGKYSLSVKPGASIVFSCVGYATKSVKAGKKSTQLNVVLSTSDHQLGEVVVKRKREHYRRKDNPSVILARNVIAHKNDHSVYDHDYYSSEKYEKLTYSLNNFDDEKVESWKKKFSFIESYVDSSALSDVRVLPISESEKISSFYYQRKDDKKRTVVDAARSAGIVEVLPDGFVEVIKRDFFPQVDIHDDNITLLAKKFVSPMSSFAPTFYKFYILDSLYLDDGKKYIDLGFAPLVAEATGFVGHLYVSTDSTYFVKKVELNLPPNININYVKNMRIQINNERLADSTRITKSIQFDSELNLTSSGTHGLYAHQEHTFRNFNFAPPEDTYMFASSDPIIESPLIHSRDDSYWDYKIYGKSLQKKNTVQNMLAEMRNVPLFYWGEKIFTLIFKGFVPLDGKKYEESNVLLGPIYTFLNFNKFEGARLKAGGLTTANMSKRFFTYGYVAWGTKDHEWKYCGEAEWSFRDKKFHAQEFPIQSIKARYSYDTKFLGQDPDSPKDNILLSMRGSGNEQVTFDRRAELVFNYETWSGFSTKLTLANSREYPTRFTPFVRVADQKPVPYTDMTTATLQLRYAPHESYFQALTYRESLSYSGYPILSLNHTIAKAGVLGSDYDYQRTDFKYAQRYWMGGFGYINTFISAGKVWSRVPFTMLAIPNSNPSWTIQKESFSLLNPMEFVHDQYVTWDLHYFMNGLILNNIPGIRKLKWREVLGFRGIYGSLSDKNNPMALNEDGSYMNPDLLMWPAEDVAYKMDRPYMEISIGLDNVFKVVRMEYVHRLNYFEHDHIHKNGFQATIHLTF